MSLAQVAVLDTGSNRTLAERLIDQLADRIGGLGVELADIAGNVQEVANRVANQSERFHHLQETAETMVSANHDIANASQAVQTTTSAAVGEIAQSRSAVDTAVNHISDSDGNSIIPTRTVLNGGLESPVPLAKQHAHVAAGIRA